MHKAALLLLAISSISYAASDDTWVLIANVGWTKDHVFQVPSNQRNCVCVKNVQTYRIYSDSFCNARAFSSSDCTGNFQTITSTDHPIGNAQWVNTISFGKAGISSSGPSGCPNWYA
ncbi:hypothetical protein K457DRAFT_129505 [Linnemannia elongata AG-77]|uniref:Uncharacterized protein n=1 Tax=Linnemannia elongata AG-77 TaxID=1314771 RepID=A0A197JII7_9FUNG|nr:hypothetical protein K457DRAFT_129505 [Linnemannia elongata AG-77]